LRNKFYYSTISHNLQPLKNRLYSKLFNICAALKRLILCLHKKYSIMKPDYHRHGITGEVWALPADLSTPWLGVFWDSPHGYGSPALPPLARRGPMRKIA
jgi:hypothetical protein